MARALDAGELHALYVELAPAAHRRARALLGDESEAWDVVQEVFRKLVEDPAVFRREAEPLTFVYRVTTNLCLNLLRSRKVRRAPPPDDPPALQPAQADARDLLHALLDRLDARALQIATLHFFDGLTQEEIAEVVQLSRKTVGLELQKIRALAAALAEPGGTP
jgi:RNA polymerase sigma-70 factor (ECF subfamily)